MSRLDDVLFLYRPNARSSDCIDLFRVNYNIPQTCSLSYAVQGRVELATICKMQTGTVGYAMLFWFLD